MTTPKRYHPGTRSERARHRPAYPETRVHRPQRRQVPSPTEVPPPPRPRYRLNRRGKIVFAVLPVLLVAGIAAMLRQDAAFTVLGLEDGALLGRASADAIELTIAFEEVVEPERLSVRVDDLPVPVSIEDDGVTATAVIRDLADGDHEAVVELARSFPSGSASHTVSFTVDTAAPAMDLLEPTEPVGPSDPVTVRIGVDDPGATVTIDGRAVALTDGEVLQSYDRVPKAAIEVRATDAAGNETLLPVSIPLALAGEPGQDPIRGVHASGWTWATPELKDPIMQMIAEGKINTVEIDLKDESGDIWYATEVTLAHEIGAVTELWDLEAVVAELHDLGVRVIGRIVNFRDPRLADHAVQTGQMDLVVQNPNGTAYGKYGGFTNPFNRTVWEYNIALAEEAGRLGVDDVMFDYVRRPDDYLENLRFPGQDGAPEEAILGFLELARERVHGSGARLAAAVFGIAATRPDEVAQPIPAMSEIVDYIAPMVYPSHWGPNEYGVAYPNGQPYDIVYRSMLDFVEQTAPAGAGLVVWLQDFSLGVDYGTAEVKAQIDAAIDAGVPDFLLWDAATTYTASALE